jgi:succinate dehydrogenase/fumarate reductase flavoprotein subunit
MKTLCDDWIQRNHDKAKRAYESGGCVLGITAGNAWYLFAEIIALRKQAILDRQSREASQVEFARLNRELNEAKEKLAVVYRETRQLLDEEHASIKSLRDKLESVIAEANVHSCRADTP